MDAISDLLADILNSFYPDVVFDVEGLARLLIPCLAVVIAAVAVWLVLKMFPISRRVAYIPMVAALIVMMAVLAFFPATLSKAGDKMVERINQQIVNSQPPEGELTDTP